jgi:hypothetical protein
MESVAREIVAGHNWRNLPILAVLTSLLCGNALVPSRSPWPRGHCGAGQPPGNRYAADAD